MRQSLICIGTLVLVGPALAVEEFRMTPLVSGVYACEVADIRTAPAMFGLTDDSAFTLLEGPGDLMIYDGVSGVLQFAMMGSPPNKYLRTGPEEFHLLLDGDREGETVCRIVPDKDPNAPPW